MGNTGNPWALPWPDPSDSPDVPRDLESLARAVAAKLTDLDGDLKAIMAGQASATGAITGEVRMVGFAGAPPGWLECDGRVVKQATYPELFAIIGHNFADGRSRLLVISGCLISLIRTRTASCPGSAAGRTRSRWLGANMPRHTHTIAHTHSVNQTTRGAHSHVLSLTQGGVQASTPTGAVSPVTSRQRGATPSARGDGNHNHSVSVNAAGATSTGSCTGNNSGTPRALDNRPKYVGLMFIIYTGQLSDEELLVATANTPHRLLGHGLGHDMQRLADMGVAIIGTQESADNDWKRLQPHGWHHFRPPEARHGIVMWNPHLVHAHKMDLKRISIAKSGSNSNVPRHRLASTSTTALGPLRFGVTHLPAFYAARPVSAASTTTRNRWLPSGSPGARTVCWSGTSTATDSRLADAEPARRSGRWSKQVRAGPHGSQASTTSDVAGAGRTSRAASRTVVGRIGPQVRRGRTGEAMSDEKHPNDDLPQNLEEGDAPVMDEYLAQDPLDDDEDDAEDFEEDDQ